MPRTRVHNLNVSLDGYAAGEHVTFDKPIGEAGALFAHFDGRVIHGVDLVEDPITLDRALTSLWSQGIGAEIMGRRKFPVRSRVRGLTTDGEDGGAMSHRSGHRSSCCRTTRARPSSSTTGPASAS
jgi:hypothetical protein